MKKQNKTKKFLKDNYVGWLFNLPLVIGLLVFTTIPMFTSLYYSFLDTDGLTQTFVGFDNYIKIFTIDRSIAVVVKNTLIYTALSIPINLILSYLLALLVNQTIKGVKTFRVFYYMPVMIPAVAAGLLWKDMLDPTFGVLNKFITAMGFNPYPFLTKASTSIATVLFMNIWSIGGGMILWLAAFKNIPKNL